MGMEEGRRKREKEGRQGGMKGNSKGWNDNGEERDTCYINGYWN